MPKIAITINADTDNTISSSKNYRIFSHEEPVYEVESLFSYSDSVNLHSNDSSFLTKKYRYSTNKYDWSLWYQFTSTNYDNIKTLEYDSEKPLFFEVKFEYDNSTYSVLANPIEISSMSFIFNTTKVQPITSFRFKAKPSNEISPAVVMEKLSTFRPYAVNSANQMYIGMSYQTNLMFGHEVLYFRTLPDMSSGDFIFKEWTILNTIDKKCIKVMVPNNEFPDNKIKFNEFGMDFEIPFEIHIDNSYYQAIFGKGSEPRTRDYMYFPLLERMYQIKSSYLFKGFMLEPIYWKISLVKYEPSVDMIMDKKYEDTLSNLITSTDKLFNTKVTESIDNSLIKEQYSNDKFIKKEAKDVVNRNVDILSLNKTFMYIPLIDRYYKMSNVLSSEQSYLIREISVTDKIEVLDSPKILRAYQDSQIYSAWRNGFINTYDSNINGSTERSIRAQGPFDSHTDSGKYVEIQAFNNIRLERQRDVLVNQANGSVTIRGREHAIEYPIPAKLKGSLTFSCLFMIEQNTINATFINCIDNHTATGLKISLNIDQVQTIKVKVNLVEHIITLSTNLVANKWYGLIVPMSSEFNQLGVYVYSFDQDLANINNWNKLVPIHSSVIESADIIDFDPNSNWTIMSGYYSITNIRIFNTMIQEENHEFIISQRVMKDGSMLDLSDNCRPTIKSPFISANR